MSVSNYWLVIAVVGLVSGYAAARVYYGRRLRRQLEAVLRALREREREG